MTLDTNLPEEPFARLPGPLAAFLNRLLGLRFLDLAPSLLAGLGCLLIVAAALTLVLTQRLAQIQQESRLAAAPGVHNTRAPLSGPLTPDEFTLAPDAVRQLDAAAAQIFNDSIPFSDLPLQAAKPFIMSPDDIVQYSRAVDCMTAAIYYEAGNETPQGQAAVAQVVLNRMRHPAYPNTICGVVFQGQERSTGCQFSFTCDGSMRARVNPIAWNRARDVASKALSGAVYAQVGTATHFHTTGVSPGWRGALIQVSQVGHHLFYRFGGRSGSNAAFSYAARPSDERPQLIQAGLDPTVPVRQAGQAVAYTMVLAQEAITRGETPHAPEARPTAPAAAASSPAPAPAATPAPRITPAERPASPATTAASASVATPQA